MVGSIAWITAEGMDGAILSEEECLVQTMKPKVFYVHSIKQIRLPARKLGQALRKIL